VKDLIISPHVDDEVLGCGGILSSSSHVYFCGLNLLPHVTKEHLIDDLKTVAEFLKYSWDSEFRIEANRYQYYGEQYWVNVFQKIINEQQPDRIFLPYPSYNQDHRLIYDTAMTALRPHDEIFFVKKVLVYELLDCFWYNMDYEVNYFVPINIEQKLEAYRRYKTLVRQHRSLEQIEALARLRGQHIGVVHAEAFIIKRWVD